jgi:hypothetical protein
MLLGEAFVFGGLPPEGAASGRDGADHAVAPFVEQDGQEVLVGPGRIAGRDLDGTPVGARSAFIRHPHVQMAAPVAAHTIGTRLQVVSRQGHGL